GSVQIVKINRERIFTFEEAQSVLPVVVRITEGYVTRVHDLMERLENIDDKNQTLIEQLEEEADVLIKQWQSKVKKLGALPKGLWIADFDTGDGYYCWKFPEEKIIYWH